MAPEGNIAGDTAELTRPARKRPHKTSSRERLQQFDMLLNISRRLSGMEALDEILDAVVELTSQAIGCDRSTFFLHDSGSNELFSRTAQGLLREIRLPSSGGVAAAAPRCLQFFAQFQDNSVEIAGFGKRGEGIVLDWTDRGIH